MKSDRYKIINESVSKHCCFAYTIIDTETENPMCETFDKEEAEIICDALNKYHLNTNTVI